MIKMIAAWGDSVHPQNHSSSNKTPGTRHGKTSFLGDAQWGPEGFPNNMVVTLGCLPEPAAETVAEDSALWTEDLEGSSWSYCRPPS